MGGGRYSLIRFAGGNPMAGIPRYFRRRLWSAKRCFVSWTGPLVGPAHGQPSRRLVDGFVCQASEVTVKRSWQNVAKKSLFVKGFLG